ncbi:hypothetical protein HKD37_12G033721 [Glycine soja]
MIHNPPLVDFCEISKTSSDTARLLSRSLTVPTNQHETFQHVLSSFTRFLGNFRQGHSSLNCSKTSMLNCGVLK